MIPAGQILDRGRLALGLLLVAPLGVLLPAMGQPGAERSGHSTWGITATTPNPISTAPPTAQDIVANLTNGTAGAPAPTGASDEPSTQGSSTGSPSSTGIASAPTGFAEVGSESDDPPASSGDGAEVAIPGTAPDAALAERLRESQSRFSPPARAETPDGGAMPVSSPSTASFGVPAGATHLFPVAGGASFTNDWGGPRPGGRSHQGIDMFAVAGAPIVAISDGTLFRVGWNRVGGWRFWLRDRWGNEFYHAHLSGFTPAAREGATVTAGTVIGYVGNSGDAAATPPHLHFEIHPGGKDPVPPFSYVSTWPRV